MARIALDASYTLGAFPTGSATYSRRFIEALAQLAGGHQLTLGYRLSRYRRHGEFFRAPATRVRFITPWLPWSTDLFHCLGQRPPSFRFKREIVTIHDILPITSADYAAPDYRARFSQLLRRAAARADCILTGSNFTSEQLQAHCRVPADRIRVIPYGVDAPRETECDRARWVGPGKEMILCVGMIEVRKNVVNSVRALRLLPDSYDLVMAGGDGYGAESIRAFMRDQNLGGRVHLPGYVSETTLARLYRSASVLLFPSLDEGFGLPVLEAMAYGLPVVISNTSSLPEVGGDAALYANPRDPEDIADKIQQTIENRELRERMIARGLARAREFTWRSTAERTLRVYEEFL